jgi:hypothetical protein
VDSVDILPVIAVLRESNHGLAATYPRPGDIAHPAADVDYAGHIRGEHFDKLLRVSLLRPTHAFECKGLRSSNGIRPELWA